MDGKTRAARRKLHARVVQEIGAVSGGGPASGSARLCDIGAGFVRAPGN